MSRLLPRYTQDHVERERRLAAILLESGAPAPPSEPGFVHPSPGDLRGIPAIGRGVSGVSPGTDPYAALLRSLPRDG